jgi:hypothetical protein
LVSPILVRPVREQLEHDRVIRLLQAKNKRRFEVGINPGAELNVPVGTGPSALYPDLVLQSPERGHRVQAVVEVETGESVNHLEALAQWAHYGRLRVPFHLYVPAGMVDVARRLGEDNQIHISEIWSFHAIGDQVRFTLVHRSREVPGGAARKRTPEAPATVARKRPPEAPAAVARKRAASPAPASRRSPTAIRTVKGSSRTGRKPAKKKPARAQKRR